MRRITGATIELPHVDAKSLKVRGASKLQGITTIGTTAEAADLIVRGGTSVSGDVSVEKTLTVKGDSGLANVGTADLSATGDVSVEKTLTVKGQ